MSGFVPYLEIDGDWEAGLILLCDHARNTLPSQYGSLGLAESEFERHIAYDIGVEGVTRGLAQALGVPALMTTFSRLLIDPNRGEDDPTIVMRLSDGTVIPGNHPISSEEIEYRKAQFHRPYHAAIKALIDKMLDKGIVPCIFSIHSFTDNWKGMLRPWDVAILWDSDPRMVRPLLTKLEAEGDLVVGDNQPYDGALGNDTMYTHCTARGLAHALIEVRQDLISNEDGIKQWVDRLAPILKSVIANPDLHEVKYFGSRTGLLST